MNVACLSMYDGGALTAANDALWSAIARRLGVSFGLTRGPWKSEALLFGQVCGYPFATRYREQLRLVATPVYSAPGCVEATHQSFVVVPSNSSIRDLTELRDARAAINEPDSMTGRHLLGDAIASAGGTIASTQLTGSHAASLARVAAGEADVAAIDCVTYAHLDPKGVRIVHRTRHTPSLPFVTAGDPAPVRRALADAIAELPAVCRRLRLEGIRVLEARDYDFTLEVAANADRVLPAS